MISDSVFLPEYINLEITFTKHYINTKNLATLLEGAGCFFWYPSIPNLSKFKNGVKRAVKLENEVIIVQRSVPTINGVNNSTPAIFIKFKWFNTST